jgi:hypothetical protein
LQAECQRESSPKIPGNQTMPKSETTMESETAKTLPKLEASINLREKRLEIEYKVKNTTEKPIYLFNVLWEYDNTGKVHFSPQKAYACLRNDGTLYLAKIIPPIPQVRSVEIRLIPYVTKVDAGKEFIEKVELVVPVEEFNPYFPKMPNSELENRFAESVEFGLQFLRESDGLKVSPTQIEKASSVWHPNIFGNVENLITKPKPISVEVRYRKDAFERF